MEGSREEGGSNIIGSHYQTKLCSLLRDAMGKNALSALRKLQSWPPVCNVIQRLESLFIIFPLNVGTTADNSI